uniref:uncharacterized protein LOC118539161 n=1 Tax=Halichoerus grypus TaxID=9711 RepID=UPI0016592798|nr:uncharacterized protein LOC118539161 [Halichoerus grypus]
MLLGIFPKELKTLQKSHVTGKGFPGHSLPPLCLLGPEGHTSKQGRELWRLRSLCCLLLIPWTWSTPGPAVGAPGRVTVPRGSPISHSPDTILKTQSDNAGDFPKELQWGTAGPRGECRSSRSRAQGPDGETEAQRPGNRTVPAAWGLQDRGTRSQASALETSWELDAALRRVVTMPFLSCRFCSLRRSSDKAQLLGSCEDEDGACGAEPSVSALCSIILGLPGTEWLPSTFY